MPRNAKRPPPTGSGGYQPAVAATGQAYGAAGEQIASQEQMPLPLGTPPPPGGGPPGLPPGAAPPGPGGAPGAMGAPPAPDLASNPILAALGTAPPSEADFLGAPSQRPDENLMAGVTRPTGGPGDAAIRPPSSNVSAMAQILAEDTGDPVAQQIADSSMAMGL